MVTALPSLQTVAWADEKPLPQLPSPTLSNIDLVLPINGGLPAIASPPRVSRRPPSPSYLLDRARESPAPASRAAASAAASSMGRKEKMGRMGRKVMLLRGRTASGGSTPPRGSPSQGSIELMPSSPVLQDVGNLAPEQPEAELLRLPERAARRRASGSSSSGLSGMTAFLEKYTKAGIASDEDLSLDSSEHPAPSRDSNSRESLEEDADELRRRQQQEEYESAILSQRAEQILANAKKRLNVMEGNLRGARDLVQPLTAANLKRATSLSGAVYGNGRTLLYDYDDQQTQAGPRKLHAQQSSPHMGNDYRGHNRKWSNALPDRPYTSLEHRQRFMNTPSPGLRFPVRVAEPPPERDLRATRSHEQLGASAGRATYSRQSPDQSHLEPLAEDEERKSQRNSQHTPSSSINNGLGIYRPASRTSDLRDQMSSLKGKISTLKDRARADSLRRQSQSSLRHQTPFNNATTTPPEMYYSPGTDDHDADEDPDRTQHDAQATYQPPPIASRNAFAEQATPQTHEFGQARVVDVRSSKTPNSKFHSRPSSRTALAQPSTHRRTASGSTIVGSARDRYAHHQYNNSRGSYSSLNNPILIELPTAHMAAHADLEVPSPALPTDHFVGSAQSSPDEGPHADEPYAPSEAESSVYEDAHEQVTVVAHEDREDAFDYEHFFLHSAMGSYSGDRRGSVSSEASDASGETARGPALVGYEDDDAFDEFSGEYPPPIPETPERLRAIERNLHQRTLSSESATTMNTFATAEEGDEVYDEDDSDTETEDVSPLQEEVTYHNGYIVRQHSVSPLPIEPPSQPASRTHYRRASTTSTNRASNSRQSRSRPENAVVRQVARRDSSSDRADSGVGMSGRNEHRGPSQSNITHQSNGKLNTPPMSPLGSRPKPDPTTIAVQALLDPEGRSLGLRNKAVLFGIVESLRKVARQMQEEEDATFASRMLRNTLDEAKRTLDGL